MNNNDYKTTVDDLLTSYIRLVALGKDIEKIYTKANAEESPEVAVIEQLEEAYQKATYLHQRQMMWLCKHSKDIQSDCLSLLHSNHLASVAESKHLAINILSHLFHRHQQHADFAFNQVMALLDDTNPEIVSRSLLAMRDMLDDVKSDAINKVLPFAESQHEQIRLSLAHALLRFKGEENIHATYITLCHDTSDAVREVATFAIASQDSIDNEELRNLLLKLLDDAHICCRFHAMEGLASRQDLRIVNHLKRELASTHAKSFFKSAKLLAFPPLLPSLNALTDNDYDIYSKMQLNEAIEACS